MVSLVTTALVAGGAGAAIALALNGGGRPLPKPTALPTAVKGNSAAQGGSGLDVQAIAAMVEQATIDITAVGPDQGQEEGTGMVLTPSGIVLTNNHVVEGSTQLTAQVDGSGPTYPLTVVGTDPSMDIAVLQLQGGRHWKTVTIGNSAAVAVGGAVVAIGNALDLPGPETVTSGIISGTGRSVSIADPIAGADEDLSGLLETSAAISSGNSGGPLVGPQGQVIGMNTATASGGGPGDSASNVGFAIPINVAMSVAHQIEAGRASATIHLGSPAATGLALTSVACAEGLDGCLPLGFGGSGQLPWGAFGIYQPPVSSGAVVAGIDNDCPAATIGLQVGDVITSFDGKAVSSPDNIDALVNPLKVGQQVTVRWVGQNGSHRSGRFQLIQGPNL